MILSRPLAALAFSCLAALPAALLAQSSPAFTPEQLRADPVDAWVTNGGNSFNQRFSPLDQINRSNVANLKAEWRVHMNGSGSGPNHSGQSQPLFYDGTLYVSTGENDIFAIDVADARGADRTHEGHARNRQRSRSGDHRDDIGFGFAVKRQNLSNHVDFVVETFGEQRTDRTVDQAGNQGFLLGGTAFTLEEAARNTAAGIEFFLVVDGQREKIHALALRLGGHGGDQDHGAFDADDDRTTGLTRDFTGFDADLMLSVLEGFHDFCHCIILFDFRETGHMPVFDVLQKTTRRRSAALGG